VWHGAQPPYPGPPFPGPPYPGPPYPGQPGHDDQPDVSPDEPRAWPPDDGALPGPAPRPLPARPRRTRLLAFAAITLGTLGFVGSLWGLKAQVLPRHFSAAQQQQITNWEYAKRWRLLPAGTIFPATVRYAPPAALDDDPSLSLAATRIGMARQDSCAAAADPTAAAMLDHEGCTAVLRATYEDSTDSYVVTVGAAVLPGAPQAAAAARALAGTANGDGLESGVRTVPFAGTPAAAFTNSRRQLSGAVAEGSYVVLYTVGYTDSRPRQAVAGDSYAAAEMTSIGLGVAQTVRQVLGAPVAAARCPGTPGC
jgi:hypothetical protein